MVRINGFVCHHGVTLQAACLSAVLEFVDDWVSNRSNYLVD